MLAHAKTARMASFNTRPAKAAARSVPRAELAVGNVYPGVKSHAACCNLCSSQPQCGSWQWGTDGVCKLMHGLPKYLGKSAQHALGIFNKNVRYFSGPNALLGETCDVGGMSTNVAGYLV